MNNKNIKNKIINYILGKYNNNIIILKRVLKRIYNNEKKGEIFLIIILQKSNRSFILIEKIFEIIIKKN